MLALQLAVTLISTAAFSADVEWRHWGNGSDGSRFSQLGQITPRNVRSLKMAWTFHTGHITKFKELQRRRPSEAGKATPFQATPLMANGSLYFCDPLNRVFALDAATGEQKWMTDPVLQGSVAYAYHCRGISYWEDPTRTGACSRRILEGTLDARLIALDAETGQYCADFGRNGQVDLREGMGDIRPGEYSVTSPPTIVGNLAVTGALVSDDWRKSSPAGVVRAFDVATGRLVWSWNATADQSRQENPPGSRDGRWVRGTPNAWSIFSFDEKLGLIYIPTGNPGMDVYGADRNGSDRFGSSVVALHVATGKIAWNFQVVHNDRWDYDVAAQPVLYTHRLAGQEIPAVAVATKMSHVFLLDRRNGTPLFPVEERPVPATDVPEEIGKLSLTQPFPTHPTPLYGRTGEDFLARSTCVRERAKSRLGLGSLRNEGIFTPPSLEGTLVYPGPAGGINWGGLSVSPDGLALTQINNLPFVFQLMRKTDSHRALPDGNGSQTDLTANLDGSPYYYKRHLEKTLGLLPCVGAPMAELIAIDLTSGEVRWRRPWGGPIVGSPVTGGILQTSSGLGFAGSGYLSQFAAFDLSSGRKLWDAKVDAQITATPMTYQRNGEQYVVTVARDAVTAFKLGKR